MWRRLKAARRKRTVAVAAPVKGGNIAFDAVGFGGLDTECPCTLPACTFAFVRVLCQTLQPGCLTAAVNPRAAHLDGADFPELCVAVQHRLGDVIPVTVHTRAVAALEMFVGVMSIAPVVSRLIGLSVASSRRD
ncbi:MAG TPA: hypothetical protein VGN24_06365 [Rhodanobacter sp.]|jgi:hypothetical protein|nr:hypothetical protein [Rhodanobacter sp.]